MFKIKYLLFYVKDMDRAIAFYKDILGFIPAGEISLKEGQPALVMKAEAQDIAICLAKTPEPSQFPSAVIVTAEDCLKSFTRIRAKNVTATGLPHYGPAGLTLQLADDNDHHWIILEERDYAEIL